MFYFSSLNIKAISILKQVHFLGSLTFSTNPEVKVEGKCYCLALRGLEVLLLAGVPHIHRFCGTGIWWQEAMRAPGGSLANRASIVCIPILIPIVFMYFPGNTALGKTK